MNDLEILALRHIVKLSEQVSKSIIDIGLKSINSETALVPERDIYPADGIAMEIGRWAKAIIDNK